MISDQAERERALDPAHSFIVQAPAGSGKTGLLVQRYLRLLSLVERPENVVAITFTRKAAAELKDRVLKALLAPGEEECSSEHDRRTQAFAKQVLQQDERRGWNLLLDPSRLQVQTIDSLCALLTRQRPLLSKYGQNANVVEDALELYRLAARTTMHDLAEGPAAARDLLKRLGVYFDGDFAGLETQIAGMLAQRDQWHTPATPGEPQVADFYLLLTNAEVALTKVFQDRNTVDFIAITEAAIEVLGSSEDPSDLLFGLDFRIQHLLVDEFQDTSLTQYRLLNALTAQWSEDDGHTLFLVGDPMQSIYRFRGAEVSLFLQSWDRRGLESVRLRPVALRTNFRSTPQILSWVQEQFQPVMQEESLGGVPFRHSVAGRDGAGEIPKLTALADASETDEAALVASLARAARKKGSAAILVRSRNHLRAILPALRDAQIPYEAIEIDRLTEQQHIIDVIALMRALLHPGDRIAWLACLRAPWAGLDIADLSALAENEDGRSIPELLQDMERLAAISVSGRRRAVRAGEILLAAADRAGRVPLRRLVEDTWLLLGGAAILQSPYQREDVETLFSLIEGLEEGGVIRDSTALATRLDVLFAKPSAGDNFVQVMTVHKAKGLEFDTVILPQLSGRAKSADRELLLWNEEIAPDGSVTLTVAAQPRKGATSDVYDAVNEARKEKDEQELKRLFYVACTRAKNELYLVGNVRAKKDGSDVQKPSSSFLRVIWDNVNAEFRKALHSGGKQQTLFTLPPPPRQTILRRLPDDWALPRFASSVKWKPPFVEAPASERKIRYEWVGDAARHAGTVVHEFLKRAGTNEWTAASFENKLPLIESELARLGVNSADLKLASAHVLRALQNTFSSARGRWIMSPHAELRVEYPLAGRVGERLINGTLDRLFRDETGRLWIVDFKTSDHEGTGRERFLDEERRRYASQMENYAALLAPAAAGSIHLGLYFPLLDGWREWAYETAALVAH